MQTFTVNINKPVVGVRKVDAVGAYRQEAGYRRRKVSGEKGGRKDEYERDLKHLQDQLEIMEKELQKAREESFQAGYDEGRERAEKEAGKQIEALTEQSRMLKKQYEKALLNMDLPVLHLATMMAKKVLRQELKHLKDYESVLRMQIKKMLEEVIDQNKVVVQVNPDMLETIKQVEAREELNAPSTMQVNFVGDASLQPGECRLKTENFFVDASIDAQLEHIEEQLKDKEVEWIS